MVGGSFAALRNLGSGLECGVEFLVELNCAVSTAVVSLDDDDCGFGAGFLECSVNKSHCSGRLDFAVCLMANICQPPLPQSCRFEQY